MQCATARLLIHFLNLSAVQKITNLMGLQVLLPLSGIVDEALDNNYTVESSTDIF